MKKIKDLWKYEKYFFLLFILISLLPIVSSRFFPTIDGPAHLHNANLLRHIWFDGNTSLLQFFEENRQLNSNWINHAWYAVSGLFLPSWLVEKSILVFYVVSMPLSFRYLAKTLSADEASGKISSYLIFPFIYNFPFCIGFFNFCIGIPLLFWTIGYWLKNKDAQRARTTMVLTILSTLIYLCHLFNFLLLELILFSLLVFEAIREKDFKRTVKKSFHTFILSLPGLILLLFFIAGNSHFKHDPPRYLSTEKLIGTITDLGPIITLNKEKESGFAAVILYSICFIVLLVIVKSLRRRNVTSAGFSWLLVSLTVLVFYFIFPDWLSSGGFISIRWALFFFLAILAWISASSIPAYQLCIPVTVILVTHLFFIRYHKEETKQLSADAEEAASAESHMEENTVLLPMNYSDNWIHINYGCYQVTEKAIVVLDNYEATKPHFPLLWKQGQSVYDLMKHYGDRNPPCINIANYENVTKHRIDYVSRWIFGGDLSDSCTSAAATVLAEQFELIYESPRKRLQLFKRKNH